MYLAIYLSIYLSIYPSIHLSICLFLSIYLSVYLSTYLPIYLPIYLSMYLSIYLSLSISIYLYLSLSISIYLYLSLSISIYLYLSLSISIYLYLSLSIYLSIYLIYLSIYIYHGPGCDTACAMCFQELQVVQSEAISAASKIHDLFGFTRSMAGLEGKVPLNLMIQGYPLSWKPPYIYTHLVCICISFHIFHHTHRLTINLTINTLQVPCFADQSPVVAAQWHPLPWRWSSPGAAHRACSLLETGDISW